jgi:hypothetical protein
VLFGKEQMSVWDVDSGKLLHIDPLAKAPEP